MGNITKQLRFICFYIALFLCIGGIKAQQQLDPQRTNIALPITKTYNDSTKVHLFNLGIFNNINLLKGVQIGVIHADVHQDMKGLNIGGLVSLVRQDAKGMTFGGLLNGVGNDMKGLQISPVSNVLDEQGAFNCRECRTFRSTLCVDFNCLHSPISVQE